MQKRDAGATTVTRAFLFTDLEQSTAAWEAHPDRMADAMRSHDEIVARLLDKHGGSMVKHMGDGVIAAFGATVDAVACAVALQFALADMPVRTRMGIHLGVVEARDDDYFGPTMNRSARVMGIAHGGQILISGAAETALTGVETPFTLRSLGDHRLKGLRRAEPIFQVEAAGLRGDFPPVNSLNSIIGNLPAAPDLVGRAEVLDHVERALTEESFVALVGPGGVGKTSLAVAAAAAVDHETPDGTWLIDFTDTRPNDLARVIVEVVGLGDGSESSPQEALETGLASRRARLVLDNCEAVAGEVGQLIDALAAAAPHTRVLVTSRVRIPSAITHVVAVDPLAVDSSAVDLFMLRAEEARAGALSEEDRPAVAELCRALDGLPLAIELAASRVKVLSPGDILDRLDRRFALLKSSTDRSHTLLATLEWSFDLLHAEDQNLFVRLGSFRSPFDLSAAMAVARDDADEFDVLESLTNLVDSSLIITAEEDGETVYRRLESVREFAALRLADSEFEGEARLQHLSEMERFSERTATEMLTDACRMAADRAARRMPDIRHAVAYATDNDPAAAQRIVESLWMALALNGQPGDAAAWLTELVDRLDGVAGFEETLSKALARGCDFHFQSGDHGQSAAWAERSIELAEEHGFDPPGLALMRRATARVFAGDVTSALLDCDHALAQADRMSTMPHYMGALGVLVAMCGETERGQSLARLAIEDARKKGPHRLVTALLNLNLATPPESADERIERSLEGIAAARLLRSRPHENAGARALAMAKIDRGDDDAAATVLEALLLAEEVGHRSGVVELAEQLSMLVGDAVPFEAAMLLSVAAAHRDDLKIPTTPAERKKLDSCRESLRSTLGAERYADASAAIGVGTILDLADLSSEVFDLWTVRRAS